MTNPMIRLDIFADVICPWCLIGKARLDRALEARPDHPFRIEWHPYQLDPDLPADGADRASYLEQRFGSRVAVVQAHMPLLDAAKSAGVTLNLEAITRTPNTLDAHRLIHWAGLEGRQSAMVSTLFRAYWTQGRDIGDRATLTALAGDAGLDRAIIARLLDGDADRDAIPARARHARERGISAVPTFIVADRHVVSGAQPPEVWTRVIDDLAALPQAEA